MPKYNRYNETKLLSLISKGDEQAYSIIFHQYFDHVYSVALAFTKSSEMAKDIAQEVFIRIWHYREKLAEVNNFECWLAKVVKNYIRNTLKKKVLATNNETYLLDFMRDHGPSGLEKLEHKEWENKLFENIKLLPPQMRQALYLNRFEGLSHKQIAAKMNISRFTSQNHVARALLILRKSLGRDKKFIGLSLLFLMLINKF